MLTKKTLRKIFQFLYAPIFWVLDFFMRHYKTNRQRLDSILAYKGVSVFFQGLAVVLLLAWILVFYFASDESRNRLTEEIRAAYEKIAPP